MWVVWSGSGLEAAGKSILGGIGMVFATKWAGLGGEKSMGLGFLVTAGMAWWFDRDLTSYSKCMLFFLPLRILALPIAAMGIACFLIPQKVRTPVDPRLAEVVRNLNQWPATASSGTAQALAARYAELQDPALGDGEKRCHLVLDASDLHAVRKAELYVRAPKLMALDGAGKRSFCVVYLQKLRADFPQAACHVAVRTLVRWEVQGSSPSAAAVPLIHVGSDSPRF